MDNLEARLRAIGFHLVETGGGCTAYQNWDGSILITKYGDPSAPEMEREIVTVGFYPSESTGSAGLFSCPLGLILNGTITFDRRL
jgi:hypothetical protein